MNPVQRTVFRTVVVLMGMFAFAFALVPLYDAFCKVTGINGKVGDQPRSIVNEQVDTSRYVTVQFITRSGKGLPWQLEAEHRQVRVHPGQPTEVNFAFSNNSSKALTGRAVPSVSPSQASLHLRKVQCFCFEEQRLEAGERLEVPLVFQLTRDLPPDINTVTLVYTLYPVADSQSQLQAQTLPVRGGDV
ncbi:cytochrome c oxidase assembly protein [Litchfieldella qijiaojingensis]|uniref:Cytochrome c oxidase assembly protein CtaG n=1 Tax=Litchfieldella qijiaojingensis TaxID=980347 RepID=A0ABQ2YD29_9GAMM|nr:cytochrome c oxidase assembly protein [Halomonas qijiaojingensis]GGX79686.1 cytochrome c oxidase assembly protein [Halomonas qijiaojingensis]